MINTDDLVKIGQFAKPHGVKGEISMVLSGCRATLTADMCLICEIDGIPVPFFIDSCRNKSSTAVLIKFAGTDTVEKALRLSGCSVFVSKKDVPVDGEQEYDGRHYLIGYDVADTEHGFIGKITAVNDSTLNILLVVDHNGEELLIPAALVTGIVQDKNVVKVALPGGFLEI